MRECERDRRASETVEQNGFACGESATGPGALPGVQKSERLHYSGCVLTAEADWPVKLPMRDRLAGSGYVRVCAD